MTRSKVKVTSPSKLEIWPFSKVISTIYSGSRQLTTDSYTRSRQLTTDSYTRRQYLNLISLIICPSFCVTWLWTWQKRQLWRVDRETHTGLIYYCDIVCCRYMADIPSLMKRCIPDEKNVPGEWLDVPALTTFCVWVRFFMFFMM